jgi:hypothetical protein
MNGSYPFRLHPHKMHTQTAAEYEEAKRLQILTDRDMTQKDEEIRKAIARMEDK